MTLMSIALAPVLICLFYIYIRDKYEKEPLRLLAIGVLYGVVITVPIVHTENFVTSYIPNAGVFVEIFYLSFMVAALVEEGFKFAVLFFLVWKNNNFNEPFDGIVYGVFISLGFAALENILYVFNPEMGGLRTGFSRAIFSVPGHAVFGIVMGYYFALMKYEPEHRLKLTLLAFFAPWFYHGAYDFILMSQIPYVMVIFTPFVAFMWFIGYKKIKLHIERSPFKENS